MKTQTDQPAHTNGEAKITEQDNELFPYVRTIRIGDLCIAQAEGETPEIAEANAQRIVKAVNMHDELIEALTEATRWIFDKADDHEKNCPWRKCAELLEKAKQAEQK